MCLKRSQGVRRHWQFQSGAKIKQEGKLSEGCSKKLNNAKKTHAVETLDARET